MFIRVLILVLAVLCSQPALAERKVALLIGNAKYGTTASSLKNPLNDTAIMRKALVSAKFEVTVVENASLDQMSAALEQFEEEARGAEIGLIYYSGHGVEIDGENYLVPVDAELRSDRKVKYEAIAMTDVMNSLGGVTTLKLVLLDACRDNPFLNSMKRLATKSVGSKGLAKVEASDSNTLIGYATAPGDVAQDGNGDNSPYAAALARHLVTPGLEIESALRAVAKDVREATGDAQTPFKTGSIYETVLLGPAIIDPVEEPAKKSKQNQNLANQTPLPFDPCRDAAQHWNEVKTSQNKDLVREHIELFGNCAFTSLAEHRIAALEEEDAKLALRGSETRVQKELQTELSRLNCEPGSLDGVWGKQSVTALNRFMSAYAEQLNGIDGSNFATVTSKARSIAPKACPRLCGAGQRLVGGVCEQVKQVQKPRRTAIRPAKKAAGSGGSSGFGSQGNCKIFNGQRICQTP